MAEIALRCLDVTPERYSAVPTLTARLRVTESTGQRIHAIALRCQIRIQPHKRRYSADEAERLSDLFGTPDRWGDTLKPMQFAHVSTMVPKFTDAVEIDVPIPCTYDFEVASSRYFHSLDQGDIPLLLLFSGTIFGEGPEGGLAVGQVPWDREAEYAMPVQVWRDLVEMHFPGTGWLRVRRDTLDALGRFKTDQAITTWDETVATLLEKAGETVR